MFPTKRFNFKFSGNILFLILLLAWTNQQIFAELPSFEELPEFAELENLSISEIPEEDNKTWYRPHEVPKPPSPAEQATLSQWLEHVSLVEKKAQKLGIHLGLDGLRDKLLNLSHAILIEERLPAVVHLRLDKAGQKFWPHFTKISGFSGNLSKDTAVSSGRPLALFPQTLGRADIAELLSPFETWGIARPSKIWGQTGDTQLLSSELWRTPLVLLGIPPEIDQHLIQPLVRETTLVDEKIQEWATNFDDIFLRVFESIDELQANFASASAVKTSLAYALVTENAAEALTSQVFKATVAAHRVDHLLILEIPKNSKKEKAKLYAWTPDNQSFDSLSDITAWAESAAESKKSKGFRENFRKKASTEVHQMLASMAQRVEAESEKLKSYQRLLVTSEGQVAVTTPPPPLDYFKHVVLQVWHSKHRSYGVWSSKIPQFLKPYVNRASSSVQSIIEKIILRRTQGDRIYYSALSKQLVDNARLAPNQRAAERQIFRAVLKQIIKTLRKMRADENLSSEIKAEIERLLLDENTDRLWDDFDLEFDSKKSKRKLVEGKTRARIHREILQWSQRNPEDYESLRRMSMRNDLIGQLAAPIAVGTSATLATFLIGPMISRWLSTSMVSTIGIGSKVIGATGGFVFAISATVASLALKPVVGHFTKKMLSSSQVSRLDELISETEGRYLRWHQESFQVWVQKHYLKDLSKLIANAHSLYIAGDEIAKKAVNCTDAFIDVDG